MSTQTRRRRHAAWPRPDNENAVIFADASGMMALTPTAGQGALELRPHATGQLQQQHLTGAPFSGPPRTVK